MHTFLSVEGSSSVCRKLIDFSKFFTRERFYFFLSMNPGNGSSIFLASMSLFLFFLFFLALYHTHKQNYFFNVQFELLKFKKIGQQNFVVNITLVYYCNKIHIG